MTDLSFLTNLMRGDEKLVQRFVDIFREQSPKQLSEIAGLIRDENWGSLSNTVHSLKTQCNYMGLSDFGERLRDIEEKIDSGETKTISNLLDDFRADFTSFINREFQS